MLVDRRNGVKGSFPDDVFPCEKCGESFLSKEIMMTHLSSHNVKTGPVLKDKEQELRIILNARFVILNLVFGKLPKSDITIIGFCLAWSKA